jgi:hypothetical protein
MELTELPQTCASIHQFLSKCSAALSAAAGRLDPYIHIVAHRGQFVRKHYTHASYIFYIRDYGPMQI